MKKQLITGSFLMATLGGAAAQGLYQIAPNNEATESSPIQWAAGVNYGFDDNVSPTVPKGVAGFEEDQSSIKAYISASLVNVTPQTTWDFYANLGAVYYLDQPSAAGSDDIYSDLSLGINWEHRVSDRLRLSSRNHVSYGLEPDYNYGFANTRQLEEYLQYTTDNYVGYRWTERLGTITGVTFSGIDYGSGNAVNDRTSYTVYNQFRYSASQQTTWTLEYRYSETDANGAAGDSTNHYILAGVEHRFSPNSVAVLKAGVQMRDVDGGASSDNPFVSAAISTRVNEQFSVRAFARYSMEDYGTSYLGGTYDTNNTFRLGVSASYAFSPKLTVHGGVNYILSEKEDARFTAPFTGPATLDDELLNLSLGFTYEINEGLFLNGSYNWTDSDSDIATQSYERNRASIGLRVEF